MVFTLALMVVTGCGDGAEPTAETLAVLIDLATCDQPIGGPFELNTDHAPEGHSGYDTELAALDFTVLPFELELRYVDPLSQMVLAYALELDELPPFLIVKELATGGPLARAVLGAFAVAATRGDPGVDFDFLRRGLHRFYACSRGFPMTLDGFRRSVVDFQSVSEHPVASVPKQGLERRLRHLPEQGVWVAQTWSDGTVRETEIIMAGRADGALDFLAYDADGVLMDRSEFIASDGTDISGAAPYTCLVCHLDAETLRPTIVFPQ
jgi:hypothetical protein